MDDKEVSGLITKIREELASLQSEDDLGEADKEKGGKPASREGRVALKKGAVKGIIDSITDAIALDIDSNTFDTPDIRDLVKDFRDLANQVARRDSKTTDMLADLFEEMARQIETWAR